MGRGEGGEQNMHRGGHHHPDTAPPLTPPRCYFHAVATRDNMNVTTKRFGTLELSSMDDFPSLPSGDVILYLLVGVVVGWLLLTRCIRRLTKTQSEVLRFEEEVERTRLLP